MTDTALKNPIVTAVMAVKNGEDISAISTVNPLPSVMTDASFGSVSTLNKTIIPLNAGATFTGVGEQNNFPDVFVSCKTDQVGKLYFDFSNDNENWDTFPPTGFDIAANAQEPHKAMKSGRYFRVRFTNTSGSNQTYLRIYSYYGNYDQLNSPLTFTPSSDSDATTTKSVLVGRTDGDHFRFVGTDAEGALNVHVTDHTSPFGELIVANLTPVVQADFVYGINANLFSSTLTGSGTATGVGQVGIASTSATINSSSLIQTARRAKYRAGEALLTRFTSQFTTGVANSKQLAGMRNADIDGWFIGYNGTSFGIMYRRNGVDVWVAQADFNGDKLDGTGASGVTLDPTKLNIFQLGIGYLGVRGCIFSIQSPLTGAWVTFHEYSLMNVLADNTQSVNPTMTFSIQAINTSNATNVVVKSGSVGIFIVGARERIGSTYGLNNNKSLSTTETNILTIRNNTTLNGFTNQAQIRVRSLSVATAGSVPVVFKLTKNATLGGTPSYTDVDATNSCAARDIAGTTVTGGNVQFNTLVGSNGNAFIDLTQFDIFLAPNDTLTCSSVSTSGGAANQAVAINWNEDI